MPAWRWPWWRGWPLAGVIGVVLVVASPPPRPLHRHRRLVRVGQPQQRQGLDVTDTSTADGAPLQQWSRNDGAWQQFRFVSSGSGYYRLQNRNSGKVVDLWEWNTADGAEYGSGRSQRHQPSSSGSSTRTAATSA
ncbi:RICIN domain-containing protein [Micromonospora sp. WMMB482]|uniref:RICIN domain-containing protein n=1 Tax=Micromonospora sp. WMMB482 TaxID=2849653 RepID=UPI0027DF6C90|nr:RICIN domain-containing protein [Micromonospora sp. WMMB482]